VFQPPSAPVSNAAAKNKRKKKKNASTSSQSVPPQQMPFVQPQFLFVPVSSGGMVNTAGASSVV
jgi:hypothetical protein